MMQQEVQIHQSTLQFGLHLTIDGYGGSVEKLDDPDLILDLLINLPGELGMTKVSKPEVHGVPGNDKKDPGGWSGFVVVEESHISLHTFPRRGFVSADVYTCKNEMDIDYILRYFTERFDLQDIEENVIKRGTRYPVCNTC